ncbi:MAG: hypothetical protein Q8Q33_00510, partial [Chlamydiota bacterium]|nr:hypothetical protein [Chlamydiota bacterium]
MTLRKTCSIITTIAFCLTQPVLPIDAAVTNLQPSSNKPDAITFQLPSDMGYITQRWGEESFDQENKPIILHIQDAHVDYLAQRNIAKIIQHVQNYIRLHHPDAIQDENLLVAVEGAQGFISTQFYTNLPDDDIRHHVSDHFLRKGELTGPEYQAIVGALPFDIYGVENSDLYLKHKDNYLRCQNSKIEIMQFLEVFEKELEIITQEFVGEGGRHFLTNKRSYIDGSLEFEAYCTYLTKEASQLGILWQQISPNIVLLSKLMEMQSSVDLEKLQTQTARLVEQLSKNLPREEVKSLVKQTLHYRLGKMSLSYYRYLNGLLETDKGADTDPYAQARLYTRLLENMAKIDHSALNHEIENLESQIQTGLFQSLDERKVFSFINYLSLLKDLVSLKMNRKTLQMVREESNHISKSYFQEFLDAYVPTSLIDVPDIELITKPFLEFYRIAEARDLALAHNTLDELEKRQSHVAVLLTGGFHTEGLEKQFRKRDVSYLVLMPNSDGFSEKTEEIYQSRMKGALSGLNAKMIQSAQTLHPGSLLKPIMNNPALAKQLESIMRSAFALTSGSLALAKGEDLSRLFESWRVATSNAYAELRELSFFGEDIQIGNSRIILARKGNTVIAFQFAAKDKIDEIVVPDEAVMDAGLLDGIAVRVFNPSVLDPETLPLAAKAFIEASLPGQTDIWDPALTDEKLYAYFRGKVFHWLGQGVQMKAYEYGDTVLKIPYERMFLEGDEAELIHGNPFLRTLRNIFKRYLDGTRVGAFIREGLPRMLNVVRPRKGSNVNKTIDTYRLGQRRLEGLILPYRIIRSGSFQFESDLMGRMGLSGKVASAQEEWGVLQKKADRFLFDEFKNKVDEGNIEGAKQLLRDLVALQTKLWRRGVFDWDAMNFGQNYAYNSDQGILMLDPGNISDSFDELRTY